MADNDEVRRLAPGRRREAVRPRPAQSRCELNALVDDVFTAAGRVPHRPLPGQGDGPEPPGAAVRQPAVRAGVERQLRRLGADHDGRGRRHRRPGRLLRRDRRGPRRAAEPPAAAARADRDGGAGRVRRRGDPDREAQGAAGDLAARRPRATTRSAASTTRAGWPASASSATATRRTSRRTRRPRPTRRCGSASRPGAGPACRSTCAPASGCPRRVTEIAVLFKKAPHLPFSQTDTEELGHNQLVIRVQPDEGVTLKFGSKVPGIAMEVRDVAMDFLYGEAFTESSPGGLRAADPRRAARRRDAVPAQRRGRGVLAGHRPAGGVLGRARSRSSTGPASGARRRPTRCSPATADWRRP